MLLAITIISLLFSQAAQAQDCSYKGKDFSEFTSVTTDWTGTGGAYTYKFNVCAPTVSQYFGSDCVTGMVAHQLSGTFCTANIATPSTPVWSDLETVAAGGIKLTYNTGGRMCGSPATTPSAWIINFECDSTVVDLPLPGASMLVSEPSVCNYEVTIKTNRACGGGGGDEGGLSGGSIFLIIFFVGGFVYLAAGVLYNTKQKGLTGTEAIPNIEFWRELPSLVKDGCSFAMSKARGGGGGGETYSSVP